MSDYQPMYSGPGMTGICVCGHKYEDHHLGMVMNQEYAAATSEAYVPQECEFYGSNEWGGLDNDGNYHCGEYIDEGSKYAEGGG